MARGAELTPGTLGSSDMAIDHQVVAVAGQGIGDAAEDSIKEGAGAYAADRDVTLFLIFDIPDAHGLGGVEAL